MMKIVNLLSGRQFQINQNINFVDAALEAGLTIPYSCKNGRCGTCRCRVLQGKTIALKTETGLTEEEKAEGWILSCVRAAETDVTLDVEDLGDIVLPSSKTYPCRISAIDYLSVDVIRVMLRLPPASNFISIPGQYIDLIGPGGVRRSYSLANANAVDKTLELHIRSVNGGVMSNYWFQKAKINDLLRLNGPLGTFFLRSLDQLNLVFLATGTGIAPVKAMLESLKSVPSKHAPKATSVFWGGRMPSDLYFDVQSISVAHRFTPVLSRAPVNWSGVRGYVQDAFFDTQPDLTQTVVYACGSDAMIRSAKSSLLTAGLPQNRFFADAFLPSVEH